MGAGQSLPSELTHEKLYDLTKDTRSVMNILLEYMIKEVTVRDFLALSNPAECKKYVIFKANTLYKYFYELQITPTTDKRGVIAFRPIKELASPQKDEAEKEKQSLCLILAYYYTRIFQIYGALALTLIDDATVAVKTGMLDTYIDDRYKLLAPGVRQYVTYGGARLDYDTLINFLFLRQFLSEQYSSELGFKTRYAGDAKAVIYFKRNPVSKSQGVFSIAYSGATKYAKLNVYSKMEEIGSDNLRFEIGILEYTKKGAGSTTKSIIVPESVIGKKKMKVIVEPRVNSSSYGYSIEGYEGTIAEYFNELFNNLVPYIKGLVEGYDELNYTSSRSDKKYIVSEEGTTEQLRLARTIQNLIRDKPLGHCIARALQLLRSAPFKDEKGMSYICKARFMETTSDVDGKKIVLSRSGLPLPGESIDKSPGMAALAQLFYDTIQQGSLRIGNDTLKQYLEFMKKMARLFGDDADKTDDKYMSSGLKGIKDKRDKELCKSEEGIEVPGDKTREIYSYVKKLFKIQYEHAGKCGAIFKMLFNIQGDAKSGRFRISLSDNIIKKGFPEIERINMIARKLLIDYYSNCEQTYVIGMGAVLKSVSAPKEIPSKQTIPDRKQIAEEASKKIKEATEKRIRELQRP